MKLVKINLKEWRQSNEALWTNKQHKQCQKFDRNTTRQNKGNAESKASWDEHRTLPLTKKSTHIESNAIIGATDNNLTTTAHTALANNILPHNQQYNNKKTQLCNRTNATQHTTHIKNLLWQCASWFVQVYVNQSTHKQLNSLTSECEPLVICNVSASHVMQMYPQQKAQQCEAVIVQHVAICNE